MQARSALKSSNPVENFVTTNELIANNFYQRTESNTLCDLYTIYPLK